MAAASRRLAPGHRKTRENCVSATRARAVRQEGPAAAPRRPFGAASRHAATPGSSSCLGSADRPRRRCACDWTRHARNVTPALRRILARRSSTRSPTISATCSIASSVDSYAQPQGQAPFVHARARPCRAQVGGRRRSSRTLASRSPIRSCHDARVRDSAIGCGVPFRAHDVSATWDRLIPHSESGRLPLAPTVSDHLPGRRAPPCCLLQDRVADLIVDRHRRLSPRITTIPHGRIRSTIASS
jgi:hypothetical protein